MDINDIDLDSNEPLGNKNKNYRNIFIGIIILVILGLIFFSVDLDRNKKFDNEIDNYEEQKKYEEEMEELQDLECKNVEVTDSFITINNELGLVLKNNNPKEITEYKIEVVFYDENRKPIEIIRTNEEIIYPNELTYITLRDMPKKYEDFDVLISKDYYKQQTFSRKEDVSIKEIYEDKYSKKIEVKNNSDKNIDKVELNQIFYDKNNKIIAIRSMNTYDLKKNKTEIETAYKHLYSSKDNEEIDYDRIEIILKAAYDQKY